MTTVKSIGVLSLGKMMGGLYALFGLLFGALFALMSLVGGLATAVGSDDALGAFGGLFFGVGAIFFLPLFYGLMGFLGGLLTALIYNLVAGLFGGVQLELQDSSPASFQPSSPVPRT